MARTPQQIAESSRNLPRIRSKFPGRKSAIRRNPQGYETFDGLCPSHEDREPSLSFTVGKLNDYVWHCKAGCPEDRIRADLERVYDIPAEWLGSYLRADRPRAERRPDDLARLRAECDRLRAELAIERRKNASGLAVLAADINKETELRAEIYLALTGSDRPAPAATKEEFAVIRALAVRAGASGPSAKRLPHYWPKQLLSAGLGYGVV